MPSRTILMGHLTRDPGLRRTQMGTPVAPSSLAVDRDFKDETTGEESTDFIDIVAWRQTVGFTPRFFTKGRMTVAKGRLRFRDWIDRGGNRRRATEVIVDNVYLGDSKRGAEVGGYTTPSGGFGTLTNGHASSLAAPSDDYSVPMGGGDQFAKLSGDGGKLPS